MPVLSHIHQHIPFTSLPSPQTLLHSRLCILSSFLPPFLHQHPQPSPTHSVHLTNIHVTRSRSPRAGNHRDTSMDIRHYVEEPKVIRQVWTKLPEYSDETRKSQGTGNQGYCYHCLPSRSTYEAKQQRVPGIASTNIDRAIQKPPEELYACRESMPEAHCCGVRDSVSPGSPR